MRLTGLKLVFLGFAATWHGGAAGAEKVTDPETKIDWKVIVTKTGGTDLLAEPGGTKEGTLQAMDIRFVYQTDDKKPFQELNGEKWYWVGGLDEPDGWVAGKAVNEWRTRSALSPDIRPGQTFLIKRTDGVKDSKGNDEIVYDGSAPDNYMLLAPIVSPRKNDNDPYEVFVFGTTAKTFNEDQSGKPAESNAFADAKLEVVFVVDTTASMTPLIEGVKKIVTDITRRLTNVKDGGDALAQRVRFGLVEYQDKTPGLTPARIAIKLTDAPSFVESVRKVGVANISSDEWSEDIVAGLLMAVDRQDDGTFKTNVGWSGNSSKHIILCGDASGLAKDDPKSSTHLAIADVLKRGLPDNIVEPAARARAEIWFHAILALNENGKDDWEMARGNFAEVSDNSAKFKGDYAEMTVGAAQSEEAVVKQIAGTLDTALKALKGDPLTPKQLRESAVAQGVYRLRDGTPLQGVAVGTARELNDDDQVVALEAWFIVYREMQRLKSRLTFMRETFQTLTPKERASSDRVLDALAVAFATAGVGAPVAATNLRDCVPGLPLRNALLDLSISDIASMDDAAFKSWTDRLLLNEQQCEVILNIKPGGKGVKAWIELSKGDLGTFIPVEQLP